jgi:hypothetical protein
MSVSCALYVLRDRAAINVGDICPSLYSMSTKPRAEYVCAKEGTFQTEWRSLASYKNETSTLAEIQPTLKRT